MLNRVAQRRGAAKAAGDNGLAAMVSPSVCRASLQTPSTQKLPVYTYTSQTAQKRMVFSRPALLIQICLLHVTSPDFSTDLQGESKTKLAAGVKPLAGGGGIFKSAAVEVLRRERRLMTTGDITKYAISLCHHLPFVYTNMRLLFSCIFCSGVALAWQTSILGKHDQAAELTLQYKQFCLMSASKSSICRLGICHSCVCALL